MRARALFELIPGLHEVVRPLDLADLPTPITAEPALAEAWGLAALHVKRDDLTGKAYGGSKVRNLEYFLGRAKSAGVPGVATMGPLGSHQALATAVYARQIGLLSRGLLLPQAGVREVELNARLLPAFGMEVYRCRSFLEVPYRYLQTRLTHLGGQRPFWIPPGSSDPLGVLAIVEGALEIARAVEAGELPIPDDVVIPTGTCATAAGLFLGFAIAGLPVRVVAARMVTMIITGPRKLKRMVAATLEILRAAGYRGELAPVSLLWLDDLAGPGYARASAEALAAMADVEQQGSIRTEVTYTGKTLALFRRPLLSGRRVLFWNTYSAVDPEPPGAAPPNA